MAEQQHHQEADLWQIGADPPLHTLNIQRATCAVIGMNYLLRLTHTGIQMRGMARPDSLRHPLFRGSVASL